LIPYLNITRRQVGYTKHENFLVNPLSLCNLSGWGVARTKPGANPIWQGFIANLREKFHVFLKKPLGVLRNYSILQASFRIINSRLVITLSGAGIPDCFGLFMNVSQTKARFECFSP